MKCSNCGGYTTNKGNDNKCQCTEPAWVDLVQNGSIRENNHPTVKPVTLMRYLCRLITPPKGKILDPFNGSGSTGVAAALEWFEYYGIEQEEDHVKISKARQPPPDLFT